MTHHRDAAIEAAAKALRDEGGTPGSSIHSWRCEYPDRYGPCDCVEETVKAIIEAAFPHISRAERAAALREFAEGMAPDIQAERVYGAHIVAQALLNRAAIIGAVP